MRQQGAIARKQELNGQVNTQVDGRMDAQIKSAKHFDNPKDFWGQFGSQVQVIQAIDLDITDEVLSVIPYYPELKRLYLKGNQISDLELLIHLDGLTISHNNLTDISGLRYLKNLTQLDFSNNQVQDISVLARLHKLEQLALHHNRVANITVLAQLPQLTVIDAANNQIADADFLSDLKHLRELYLDHNLIHNVDKLRQRDIWLSVNENPLHFSDRMRTGCWSF